MIEPNYEMYEEVVKNFGEAMKKELAANFLKGDRDGEKGWLTMTDKMQLNELYYHVGKLQAALKEKNTSLILELSADVANGALMVYDRFNPLITGSRKKKNTLYDVRLMKNRCHCIPLQFNTVYRSYLFDVIKVNPMMINEGSTKVK